METQEYSYTEVYNMAENIEGIYVWYLKFNIDQKNFEKVFHSYNFGEISLSGMQTINNITKLDERYQGYLNRVKNEDISGIANNLNYEFVNEFLNTFKLPLYIGRSKDIKRRINQHFENYQNSEKISNSILITDIFDSDDSTNFGKRLKEFNDGEWFRPCELSISIFHDSNLSYENVKAIEFYLNRLYKPILGVI